MSHQQLTNHSAESPLPEHEGGPLLLPLSNSSPQFLFFFPNQEFFSSCESGQQRQVGWGPGLGVTIVFNYSLGSFNTSLGWGGIEETREPRGWPEKGRCWRQRNREGRHEGAGATEAFTVS